MEKGDQKVEANNFEVSFSALLKDAVNVLHIIERLKNEEDQVAVNVADQIDKLRFLLAFICTYVELSHAELAQFEDRMTAKRQEVETLLRQILDEVGNNFKCKCNMHHVLPSLMDSIDDCINSCHRSKSSATMTDKQLKFLLLSLHHLSEVFAEKFFPSVTEYEILQNVCGNVRGYHGLIVNGCIKDEIAGNVLPQLQLMAERVGDFMWDQLHSQDSQVFKLPHLFLKIVPIQLEVLHVCCTDLKASTSAEVGCFIKQLVETNPDILREYLIHLQEHMINVITPSTSGARNIHVTIEFLLLILTDMTKDFIHHHKLFDLLAHVGALTRKVSTLVCGLEEKSRNKESSDGTKLATLDLLENIELLKEDLKNIYLKEGEYCWEICSPLTDGPLFIHLLLMHLNDLLDSNSYSVALIKEEIKLVKEDLNFIRSSLIDVEEELHKDLWKRMLDAAYEAKDVIDSIIVRDNGLLYLIFSLPDTIKRIKVVKEDVSGLGVKTPQSRKLIAKKSPKKPVESKLMEVGKVIVGFEEETNLLITKLTRGPADLDVISIVGMPGSGKTTLAYKLYNDKSVYSHFDVRAWCTVDQKYDKKKLWVEVYNQITGSDLAFSDQDIDVANMLRKQLLRKRYLIVLDDLWDTTAWDELTRPFPRVEERSRIILTTREMEVALYGMRNTEPLKLRLLRPEESWELLEKRAFGKENCPDELLDVGKEIAKNCKGLPLMADLIAGVIEKKEKEKIVWLEVLNNLNSFVFNSEVDVMKVIKLSYDHLADHLKPLFIYLATYPKDDEIYISELKDYWIAEGLVDQIENKSVEEVMEVYLDNLISSSLVISFNEIGDELTCQLHDLVHDFCLNKASEEKFFEWTTSSAPSSSDLMPRIVNVTYDKEHSGIDNFVLFGSRKKRHSGKHLYSLVINGDELDNDLSDICHLRHLRLLKVLNLNSSVIKVNDSLLNEICTLNHLRSLNIGIEVKSLPSSFSNLCNLETLAVKNIGSTLVLLPRIWDLVKLRVLVVPDACSLFDVDTDEPILIAEDSKLENLRMLGTLVLSYSKNTEDIFKRFPNLHVLSFQLKESWDYSTERFWFPKLDFLTELEDLRVVFKSSNTNDSGPSAETNQPWDFHFPSNLKKLWLVDFPLTSDSLSTIGRLPNLEHLSLFRTIIQGEEWNMGEEDTFEKLKYLGLRGVNLAKWEFGEECFPMLEKLELWYCHKLEEIPSTFGDVCSLKIIKLVASPHLEDSAKNIKEYVEDMGAELQILGPNNLPLFKHHV